MNTIVEAKSKSGNGRKPTLAGPNESWPARWVGAVREGMGRVAWSLAFASAILMYLGGPAHASSLLGISGVAYGTYAVAGSVTTVSPTAYVTRGCPSVPGTSNSSSASITDAPLVTTGTTATDVTTTANSSQGTSDVQNVSLLGGLITATAVSAASAATQSVSSFGVSAAGSMFTDLVVGGVAIASNVAPNTTILLPGFGRVMLNEQISTVNATSAKLTVNMIHVFITAANVLAIPPGTQLIVSVANSTLVSAEGPALLVGFANGTGVYGATFSSGPTAPAQLSCIGTNGVTKTVNAVGLVVPGVLSSGAISDSDRGYISPVIVNGSTTSTIATANVLNGLVTLSSLTVKGNVSTTDGIQVGLSDTGTVFTNLVVTGHPEITDSVARNTQINLPGIGTLYIHRVVVLAHSIDVHGIELVISSSNTLGLPAEYVSVGRAFVGIP